MKSLIFIIKLINIVFEPIGEPLYSKVLSKTIGGKLTNTSGAHGLYHKLSNTRGIKIIYGNFSSLDELFESSAYRTAKEEAELMIKCKHRFSRIPRCYGLRILLVNGIYSIGIMMQHLGDMMASKCEHFKFKMNDEIRNILTLAGIVHQDIHHNNLMWYNNEWWVIDFHPGYVKINN